MGCQINICLSWSLAQTLILTWTLSLSRRRRCRCSDISQAYLQCRIYYFLEAGSRAGILSAAVAVSSGHEAKNTAVRHPKLQAGPGSLPLPKSAGACLRRQLTNHWLLSRRPLHVLLDGLKRSTASRWPRNDRGCCGMSGRRGLLSDI
jgi:hypothetical protein